ncbi:MAG: hypothetical protein L0K86_14385, partial [Actinomycetia bacterium]|nr:hypothetical protein [Actinomycetes bacterium]
WYSPRFGQRVPTTTLLGATVADDNLNLVTVLQFHDEVRGTAAGRPNGCIPYKMGTEGGSFDG